jgi:2-polyprenyl-3-methyl-5-hydroxy-6-metoxy-1,4-benzoquinol methylase
MAVVQDKAGKNYWDSVWEEIEIPEPANPHSSGIRNLFYRRLDGIFREIFSSDKPQGKKILEVGCAQSVLLPYFAREFGFKVAGLDYSEIGCQQERQILQKAGVEGEIVCADFFNPPEHLLASFDYVFSNGVAEHFSPTEGCLSAFAAFLKPGGTLITFIPNMTGSVGWLTKVFNRPVYDIHFPLTDKQLKNAHENAGLEVSLCRYFLSTNFSVPNVIGLEQSLLSTKIKKYFIFGLGGFSRLVWLLENKTRFLPTTKIFSPYIVCVARKN